MKTLMTREEAKEWSRLSVVFEDHIDKIYDGFKLELEAEYKRGWKDRATQSDLENRTCESCKYAEDSDTGYEYYCTKHNEYENSYMSCNKWEQK